MEQQSNLYLEQCQEQKKDYIGLHPHSRLSHSKKITQLELKKWFAIRMLMPLHENANIKGKKINFNGLNYLDNWSTNPLFATNYSSILSRDEFWKVSGAFHLADNTSPQATQDKLHKTSNFQDIMQHKWNFFF